MRCYPKSTLGLPCVTHPNARSLSGNAICGVVDRYDSNGTYTTEGITALCEGLKGSAVTSLT